MSVRKHIVRETVAGNEAFGIGFEELDSIERVVQVCDSDAGALTGAMMVEVKDAVSIEFGRHLTRGVGLLYEIGFERLRVRSIIMPNADHVDLLATCGEVHGGLASYTGDVSIDEPARLAYPRELPVHEDRDLVSVDAYRQVVSQQQLFADVIHLFNLAVDAVHKALFRCRIRQAQIHIVLQFTTYEKWSPGKCGLASVETQRARRPSF